MSVNLTLTEHSTHKRGPGHRKGYILLQSTGLIDGWPWPKAIGDRYTLFFFKDDSTVTLKVARRLTF